MTIHYRYHLETKEYWGWTDQINDDPECGYVEQAPPEFDTFTQYPVWQADAWQILDRDQGDSND